MRKKIEYLAAHYSKKEQYEKAIEEVTELEDELYRGSNPLGDQDMVYLTDNTWSECADVIIMIAQLAIQHGKEDEIKSQMEYKLDRQLNRIEQQNWKDRVMNTFLGDRG